MKVIGIIAEYNPFHSGHAYQIRKAKEMSGADFVIAVMSPDFVQRGSCSIVDKWSRARMALAGGADLVLEMPVCYATASAEYFAQGGVSLLTSLNAADFISFGCEADDPRILMNAADFFARPREEEPEGYKSLLKAGLKAGMTYPKARMEAFLQYQRDQIRVPGKSDPSDPAAEAPSRAETDPEAEALSRPNNILAIEYLKALKKYKSPLRPLFVRRIGEGYHSSFEMAGNVLSPASGESSGSGFLSAETIRGILSRPDARLSQEAPLQEPLPRDNSSLENILDEAVPQESLRLIREMPLLCDRDFDFFMHFALVQAAAQERKDGSLTDYLDLTPDMERRIRNNLDQYESIDQFVSLLKTKQVTETRIRRSLLHILLDIRAEEIEHFRREKPAKYARILGFRKEAGPLLSKIRKNSDIPLFSSVPDALHISAKDGSCLLDPQGVQMLGQTLYSSRIYGMALQKKTGRLPVSEYRRGLVIYSSCRT